MPTYFFTCQWCNQIFPARDKWDATHRKFCSNNCRGKAQRKRIIKTCRRCDQSFDVIPSKKDVIHHCSKACRLANGWVEVDPSKHSIFTCEWCKEEFKEWTYRKPRFCSNQCRSEYAAHLPKPWQRKPEIHIVRICEICKSEFSTTTHQVRLRAARFCSVKCAAVATSHRMRGKNNPNWKGGSDPYYGPNWHEQRRKAKKRDNHTCQICNCRLNCTLNVHHIIPLREFKGDWEMANQLSNLISLCVSCHNQVESGTIMLP